MKKGFSFIELILVIALMLTLGAMSGVFYSRFLNQNSVSNVSDQFTGQLRKAQIYSMAGKQDSRWGVRFASSKITLFATRSAALDESFTVNSNILVTGFSQVIYAKTGLPDSSPTFTISAGGNTKTITINSQGVVSR